MVSLGLGRVYLVIFYTAVSVFAAEDGEDAQEAGLVLLGIELGLDTCGHVAAGRLGQRWRRRLGRRRTRGKLIELCASQTMNRGTMRKRAKNCESGEEKEVGVE
jgi:hypothetical protein